MRACLRLTRLSGAVDSASLAEELEFAKVQELDEVQGPQGETEIGDFCVIGHRHWRQQRYQRALRSFESAKSPGAGVALLCLRFCLGIERGEGGDETARAITDGLSELWRVCWEKYCRKLRILRPRRSLLDPARDPWMEGGMEIFDGTCDVNDSAGSAEIGYRLHMNRRSKRRETCLILYFHGNGEICEEYTQWAKIYEVYPCSILVFDYRGYGWSSGTPCMSTLTSDAEQCIHQLPQVMRTHGLPWPWPGPLLLMGRSLGGLVATHLIGHLPDLFDGLVLDSAFATSGQERYHQLMQWMGDAAPKAEMMFKELSKILSASGEEQVLQILGSEDFLKGYGGAVLVLHGRDDLIVPLAHGRRHYEAAQQAWHRELVELEADHNSLAGVPEFWKKQMAFAKRVVQRKMEGAG